MFWLVVEVAAIARDEAPRAAVLNAECGRALCIALNGSARYTWAWDNKSLDASGISALVIDNLSVTQLFAAASTQPLGCVFMSLMQRTPLFVAVLVVLTGCAVHGIACICIH